MMLASSNAPCFMMIARSSNCELMCLNITSYAPFQVINDLNLLIVLWSGAISSGCTKILVILLSLTLFIMTDFANFLRELLGIAD